ncbi:hypothetical protein LTR85_011580 [Meristemomyces frigidus]|nr:hypothetical protein LTR85_011580 [Meristemomyces frigidus]
MNHFPLLRLPPEIRNVVYHIALYERRPVAISPNRPSEPSLLKTCKQIRQETELMFYAINDFTTTMTIGPHKHLVHWLSKPQRKLALIKSFTVRIELPGFDFWDVDALAEISRTERMGPTGRDLPTILTIVRRCAFGQRALESVLRFSVNGAGDDLRYFDALQLDLETFRKHFMAELLLMMVVFGSDAMDAMLEEEEPGCWEFLELEEMLQEGMRSRL